MHRSAGIADEFDRLGRAGRFDVAANDLRTVRGKEKRSCAALSAGGAGDERRLTG
jgi:hypothetical protein